MSSSYETSFGSSNQGFQLGINNGTLNTGETYHITERSEVYNTEGGAVFSGNISASRDVNITHINTIRPIAQSLYSSLFTSSEIFSQVRNEIGLLVTVLSATEEHAKKAHAESFCSFELKEALDNCKNALSKLSKLKEHFDSVGAQTQVTWERMDWSKTELADIKSNLSLYIQVLNTLIARMMLSSQSNVERMLKTLVSERRNGKNSSPALSIISSGSLAPDEKEQWRQLRKELQGVGITPEIFSLYREYILDYLGSFSQGESNDGDHLETIEEDGTVSDELLEHDQGTDRDPFFRDYNVMPQRVDISDIPAYYIYVGDSDLTFPANEASPHPLRLPEPFERSRLPNPFEGLRLPAGDISSEYIDDFPMSTEDTSLPEGSSQAAEEISEFPQPEQQSSQRERRETIFSPFPPPRHIFAPKPTEEEMLDSGDVSSPIGDFKLYHDTNSPQPPSQAQVFGPEFTSKGIPDFGDVLYQSGDFRLYDNTNAPPRISSQDIYQPSRRLSPSPGPDPRLFLYRNYATQYPQLQSSDTSNNSYSKSDAALLFGDPGTGEINSGDLLGLQNQPEYTNNSSMSIGNPKLDRIISDIYQDELYNPALMAAHMSKPTGQKMMTPARNSFSSNPTPNTQNLLPDERLHATNSGYTMTPYCPPNRGQPRMIYDAANRRQRTSNRSRTTAHSRPLGTARTRGISDSQRRRYTSASSTAANFDESPSSNSVNASTQDRMNYRIATRPGLHYSERLTNGQSPSTSDTIGHISNMADPLPNHHHKHVFQVQL